MSAQNTRVDFKKANLWPISFPFSLEWECDNQHATLCSLSEMELLSENNI